MGDTREDIIRMVKEEDVEFIRLQFTDILGNFKNMAVTANQLEKILKNRCRIDGSSMEGFRENEESELFLHPDLDTFVIFPWRPQQGKVARLICDLYRSDEEPFEGDPRYLLKQTIAAAAREGYAFQIGPESEFYLFEEDENGGPTNLTREKGGYLDVGPLDSGENARREMVMTLEKMGYTIESSYHEASAGQHEIQFRYDLPLQTADNLMTFEMVVRTIARRHGLYATFMPKPKNGESGSGMHINLSMYQNGINVFSGEYSGQMAGNGLEGRDRAGSADVTDEEDRRNGFREMEISPEAGWFLAGVLSHCRGMALITNPVVNSYKRLMTGFEAPRDIAWSANTRTALLKLKADRGYSTRFELRSPDPAANPYLVLSLYIAAGLDGIRRRLPVPHPVSGSLRLLSEEEKESLGIDTLPTTLGEAIRAFKEDRFVRGVLGEHISNKFLEAKTQEWREYCEQVSQWELDRYLFRI